MRLPSPPVFIADDFPDVPVPMLEKLSRSFQDLHDALALVPDVAEALNKFVTSGADGRGTLELKNPLATSPSHVDVTLVRNDDAPDTAVPWASTWRMVGGSVRVSFVGLTASTKFRINVRFS